MMLRIDPFAAGYDAPRRAVLNGQLRTAISQLPGVETVSQSGIALMTGRSRTCCITVPGYTPAAGERMAIRTNDVTSAYFETVGMTRVAGRGFVQSDNLATSRPVIINEAFARKYFVGSIADSVGRSFAFGNGPAMPIVGVVADARYDGLREPSVPLVFFPAKDDAPLQSLEVRTAGNPSVVAAAVRRAISTVDPALPLRETFTIEQLVDASLARERLMARISTLLGSLVLVLACVGIYGLLAQLVVRRTNEIGIRMALGAERRQVIGIVMRETALLVVPGVVLGVTAAVLTTRITSSLLFGVMPNDPLSLVAAPVCLVVTALAAAWLPAHRAASITPLEALKRE
jgi:predicted permease